MYTFHDSIKDFFSKLALDQQRVPHCHVVDVGISGYLHGFKYPLFNIIVDLLEYCACLSLGIWFTVNITDEQVSDVWSSVVECPAESVDDAFRESKNANLYNSFNSSLTVREVVHGQRVD